MARTIKVPTLAGWVYLDDDDKIVEIATPSEAPDGATLFRLRSVPMDSVIQLSIADNARDRSEGIGLALRGVVAEVRGLVDDEGNDLTFRPEMMDALPVDVLMALGNHVMQKLQTNARDEAARRGNGTSGTSRGKRPSGGTATAGSRTALRATS
jgi:hypothetical protein